MRVLVIDEWMPLPLESGKKIRTFRLLSPLAERHDITYLCYADPAIEAQELAHMQEAGFHVVCVPPARRFRTPLALAAGIAGNALLRKPLAVRKHYSRCFQQAVSKLMDNGDYDVVHCEWTHYAQYMSQVKHLPKFLSSHNIESMQWRRFAQVQSNPFRRAAIHLEWLKMRAYERRVIACFDHVATVSVEDARVMRSFGADSVEVIPNGVDYEYYQEIHRHVEEQLFVYCASMDSFVNQDAARHFARSILPIIHKTKPQAKFVIVGKSPPASVQRLANDRIRVVGTVDDVRPYLRRAAVSVVPLRIGGGSRLKILEAFAAGLPVVSTSIGAEGLNVTPEKHMLIADDEETFANQCIRLLDVPPLRYRLAEESRRLVQHQYDWKSIYPSIESAWDRTKNNYANRRRKAK